MYNLKNQQSNLDSEELYSKLKNLLIQPDKQVEQQQSQPALQENNTTIMLSSAQPQLLSTTLPSAQLDSSSENDDNLQNNNLLIKSLQKSNPNASNIIPLKLSNKGKKSPGTSSTSISSGYPSISSLVNLTQDNKQNKNTFDVDGNPVKNKFHIDLRAVQGSILPLATLYNDDNHEVTVKSRPPSRSPSHSPTISLQSSTAMAPIVAHYIKKDGAEPCNTQHISQVHSSSSQTFDPTAWKTITNNGTMTCDIYKPNIIADDTVLTNAIMVKGMIIQGEDDIVICGGNTVLCHSSVANSIFAQAKARDDNPLFNIAINAEQFQDIKTILLQRIRNKGEEKQVS